MLCPPDSRWVPHNLHPCLRQYAFLKVGLLRPRKVKMTILNNITSVLKPGRATLLLGPPAAGKSTLLKALSGKLAPHGLKVGGELQGLCVVPACGQRNTVCLQWGASVLISVLSGKLAPHGLQASLELSVTAFYAEREAGNQLASSHHTTGLHAKR